LHPKLGEKLKPKVNKKFDENAKRKGSMICVKYFFEKIPKKSSFFKKKKKKEKKNQHLKFST
jgi:hypothetical protein